MAEGLTFHRGGQQERFVTMRQLTMVGSDMGLLTNHIGQIRAESWKPKLCLDGLHLTPTCDRNHGRDGWLRDRMNPEVMYARPRDCSCFPCDLPGHGSDGDDSHGRRAQE